MLLGLDGGSELFSVLGAGDASPIAVVLDGPLEPEGGLGVGDDFTLTLTGGVAIGANPPLPGKLVEVTIEVSNGTATPPQGTIHPSLSMVSSIERTDAGDMTITVTGTASMLQGGWTFETTRAVTIG